ncbi:MAG: ATP-binding protein [Promethearchaeota archaeon]
MDVKILKEVILEQEKSFESKDDYVSREILAKLEDYIKLPHVIVISGLRRCGKSTLLKQIKETYYKDNIVYYINFEDERLLNFKASNFNTIYECFLELFGESKIFFIDEIQNINGWESFVRRFYENGFKFVITGSNASLLSRELGTKLTGRHVNIVLYPFSFREFLAFKKYKVPERLLTTDRARIKRYLDEYMDVGGLPEYLLYKNIDILRLLYTDVLYRDVMVRHNITDESTIRELAYYFLSNPGAEISYNKLKVAFRLGSANTVKKYTDYMQDAYLSFAVYKHDYSMKRQIYSNKKIYIVDTGFIQQLAFKAPEFTGKVLENLIFIELKRRGEEVYYYKNKGECDFLIVKRNVVIQAIQVTTALAETKKREFKGLLEAIKTYNLDGGLIITKDNEFEKIIEGKKIVVKPAWKWLLDLP